MWRGVWKVVLMRRVRIMFEGEVEDEWKGSGEVRGVRGMSDTRW